MIELAGSVHREFVFPADQADAYAFYSDVGRMTRYLQYITLDQQSQANPDFYRVVYHTKEMGVYEVTVYSDIEAVRDRKMQKFELRPLENGGFPVVKMEFTPRNAVARGKLHAVVAFAPRSDGQTTIDYRYSMVSQFVLPAAMRFIPVEPIRQLIQRMVTDRLEEVADNFVKHSVAAYGSLQT